MTYYNGINAIWQNKVFYAVGIISIATLMMTPIQNLFAQAGSATKSGPSVEEAMRLQPVQKGVDIDNLTAEEIRSATIDPYRAGNVVGYIVKDAQGQIVRMFLDTDGSKALNQWSYYKDGLEVYRDVDTNANGKADQYRWFHSGGSRWAIDENEDGVIDYWRSISPEEASYEVTMALAENDFQRFLRVALSENDLQKIQSGNDLSQKLTERIAAFEKTFREAVTTIALTRNAKWVQFGGNKPSAIPSGRDGNKADLNIYQNSMVLVQDETGDKQLVIGSMIRIGDAWKVTDVPHMDSPDFVYNSPFFSTGSIDPNRDELIKISEEIEKLNQQIMTADKSQRGSLYDQIVNKMIEGANICKDPRERDLWLTNLADTMRTAVYQKDYPDGLSKMKMIEDKLKEQTHAPLAAYFRDRRIEAEYYIGHTDQVESPENIQRRWIDNLEGLIKDYPTTTSAAKAMLILGNYYEDIAKADQAREIYQKLAQNFSGTVFATKANGAMTRLDSVDKPLVFSGKAANGTTIDIAQSKGNIVLLYFWSTWNDSEGSEVATLKYLNQQRFPRDGLKVIGVNLDENADAMNQFIAKHEIKWPQIHEPGGMDSRPACALGVQEPPYYILIDKEGKMRYSTKFINDLDREIFNLLKN